VDEDFLGRLDALQPDNTDVSEALAFIRLVVKNNPGRPAQEIMARDDVREAMAVVDDWLDDTRALVQSLPNPPGTATAATNQTLTGLERDTRVTDARLAQWADSPEPADQWAAKVVLRMQWLLDWIEKLAGWLALGAPYKRWVSRLDPTTCKYCRGLHGAVLPATASFALEASLLGYTRVYGGLYAPPLHPRCRCWLEPVSQAEYEALSADTSGES
jgi:hypothetical protein